MFCANCGAEVHDGENFCGNCGAKVGKPTAPSPAPATPQPTENVSDTPSQGPVNAPQPPSAAQTSATPQFQTQFQEAFRPQPVQEASWDEVADRARSQASAVAGEAKAKWSTPYAIVALIGKVITLIALFMPWVASPMLKQGLSDTLASVTSSMPMASSITSTPFFKTLLLGEWNIPDVRGFADTLNRLVSASGLTGSGSLSDAIAHSANASALSMVNTAVVVTNVVFVVWILMVAAVVFSILRPFLKSAKLSQLENKYNLEMIVMLPVAVLALVWCALIFGANGALTSMASQMSGEAVGMLVFSNLLEIPPAPWIVAVASALTAFWPHLSKYVGLSK